MIGFALESSYTDIATAQAVIWKTGDHITEKEMMQKNIEEFAKRLENYKEPIEYVNPLMTHSWGQQVIRFYDPNGNLIEVGTPMESLTLPPVPAAHQDD